MSSIFFQFDDIQAIRSAAGTLSELGYPVQFLLQVPIETANLSAALDISQACGGRLAEVTEPLHFALAESAMLQSAYNLGGIQVPAHTVTEDFSEDYMHPAAGSIGESGEPSVQI
ncbi:hypothetical protein [Gorillibacterium massiliense]|uniref:hypothetical protein n=1 Tax=Gorillibacterium massiliense TaxID=1280390 RepID=UPI0004B04484|nr:hypothetical protein [Gorillibacterium massiliense]